jgi:hypothetical protein
VAVVADGRPDAVGGAAVDRDGRARGGDDPQPVGAEPVPDHDLAPGIPGGTEYRFPRKDTSACAETVRTTVSSAG